MDFGNARPPELTRIHYSDLAMAWLTWDNRVDESSTMTHTNEILRRTFLGQTTRGVGAMALASLLESQARPKHLHAADSSTAKATIALPTSRAKRVIFLCMAGGMSHLETFDNKPKLAEMTANRTTAKPEINLPSSSTFF